MKSERYHFIFIDIVGLSNPAISTDEQVEKITMLSQFIQECKAYENKRKVIPTGDGYAIGFTDSIYSPFDLAKQLHEKISNYNKGKQWLKQIQLHIGLHSENVSYFKDLTGDEENVWGKGIIKAQRVMSKSPAGFVLLTEEMGEELAERPEYKEIIYHAGFVDLKYEQQFIWYAYDDNFGRNDVSQIQDLNPNAHVTNFSATVDKIQYKSGDIVKLKIDFTGKLNDIICTVMLRAPKDETLPNGKKNFWQEFTGTYPKPLDERPFDISEIFEWELKLENDYQSGLYYLYIRVYEKLGKRRSVIREKVVPIYVEKDVAEK